MAGLAFLLLRRHRKMKAREHRSPDTDADGAEDYNPPHDKVELDARSNTLNELDGKTVVSELDDTSVQPRNSNLWTPGTSPLSEVHGSPIGPPHPSFWTPAASPIIEVQCSAGSTSAPNQTATSSAPVGTGLQVDKQQRYGATQSHDEAPLTHGTLLRPISHMPPATFVADSEVPAILRPGRGGITRGSKQD